MQRKRGEERPNVKKSKCFNRATLNECYFAAMPQKAAASAGDNNAKKLPDKKKDEKAANGNSKGLFGRLLGTIGIKVSNQAHLPDDKDQSIVWDDKTKV